MAEPIFYPQDFGSFGVLHSCAFAPEFASPGPTGRIGGGVPRNHLPPRLFQGRVDVIRIAGQDDLAFYIQECVNKPTVVVVV